LALQPEALTGKPAWGKLPAVEAGQVAGREPEPRFSYAGCAPILEALARIILGAKKVT
jgi:iron complex transport system substrate-binding protein